MPDQIEIYEGVRKSPVPPSQQHQPKKGKGSYTRKPKHSKKE
ncbi:MAG: ribosome alternative rescue factor ArfA [Parcubacteria group bacterium]|nr:ribosome alternative rescue factor ArfA [Parcubacteria group bacterium]